MDKCHRPCCFDVKFCLQYSQGTYITCHDFQGIFNGNLYFICIEYYWICIEYYSNPFIFITFYISSKIFHNYQYLPPCYAVLLTSPRQVKIPLYKTHATNNAKGDNPNPAVILYVAKNHARCDKKQKKRNLHCQLLEVHSKFTVDYWMW